MNKTNRQLVFKRYEVKFLLTEAQYQEIRLAMDGPMRPDRYGRATNYSLYYDTPDCILARRSLEKPVYKEKLRVRSYGVVKSSDVVFVELKKKYEGVTYKRRIEMKEREADIFLAHGIRSTESQIAREISYFRGFYPGIAPRILLSYEREAFYDRENENFRMTFDRNILWRDTDLDLRTGRFGMPLLKTGQVLMEVKTADAIPLWLVSLLSREHIYRTTFSKYGSAYTAMVRTPDRNGQGAAAVRKSG